MVKRKWEVRYWLLYMVVRSLVLTLDEMGIMEGFRVVKGMSKDID